MKRLLLVTLALSLPLAQMVQADNDRKKHKREAEPAAENRAQPAAPAVHRPVPQQGPRKIAPTAQRPSVNSEARLNRRDRSSTQVSNQGNNRNPKVDRSNRNFNRNSFAVARTHVIRTRHNRNWWRSRYNTFVLFGGGYYYWWNNYWYPAYGYDPYYNNYIYSEPIYGYNNLAPGQVLENVQLVQILPG